ncbi:MAG: arsenate reductase [Flavobacteriales bacterium]|jgi:arsenate reductase
MIQQLQNTIAELKQHSISLKREQELASIAAEIANTWQDNPELNLCFICTHNSRRSQIAQVWAEALAHHFELDLHSFSGGTETTTFNSNAIDALRQIGFQVEKKDAGNNSILISFDTKIKPLECFSKTWNHSFNPQENLIALMTCAEADADCPLIPGALKRFALNYEDPKRYDNTFEMEEKYAALTLQIASELHSLFNRIKSISCAKN